MLAAKVARLAWDVLSLNGVELPVVPEYALAAGCPLWSRAGDMCLSEERISDGAMNVACSQVHIHLNMIRHREPLQRGSVHPATPPPSFGARVTRLSANAWA